MGHNLSLISFQMSGIHDRYSYDFVLPLPRGFGVQWNLEAWWTLHQMSKPHHVVESGSPYHQPSQKYGQNWYLCSSPASVQTWRVYALNGQVHLGLSIVNHFIFLIAETRGNPVDSEWRSNLPLSEKKTSLIKRLS